MKFSPSNYLKTYENQIDIPLREGLSIKLSFADWKICDNFANSWKGLFYHIVGMFNKDYFVSNYKSLKFTIYEEYLDSKGFRQQKVRFEINKLFKYVIPKNAFKQFFGPLDITIENKISDIEHKSATWGMMQNNLKPSATYVNNYPNFDYIISVVFDNSTDETYTSFLTFYRTMEQGKKEPVVIKFADNDEMSYKVDCIKQFFDFCYDF